MTEYKEYVAWDAATRWFHWINALSVICLIVVGFLILKAGVIDVPNSGKATLKTIQVWIGYVLVANLLWRIVWAFFGNRYARWRAMLPGGRGYFHALRNVRSLTGIDVSRPMLEQATHPVGAAAMDTTPTLIAADFLEHDFGPAQFDLVYSIGVLAEHSPFDAGVATRVRRWLRTDGRFAFTAIDPLSFSVPRTRGRRLGEALLPVARGALRRALRARLMRDGLYADEERLRHVLTTAGFVVESIEPYENDVHRHFMTVARNPA